MFRLPEDYAAYGARLYLEQNTVQLDRRRGMPRDGFVLTLIGEREWNDSTGAIGTAFNDMLQYMNRYIVESMSGGVMTIDVTGRVTSFNAAAEISRAHAKDRKRVVLRVLRDGNTRFVAVPFDHA